MKIKVRPLNQGEIFPCSISQAKKIFKDTDVFLDFSFYGRDFGTFANTPDRFYVKKHITGKVVASSYMTSGVKSQSLHFYVLKSNEFSEELKEFFEQKLLPNICMLYKDVILDEKNFGLINLVIVELKDNQLKMHRTTFK